MPDREKVIKGLEILMNGCEYIHCDDCCFYISTKPVRCGLREEQIQKDALALLKEQQQYIWELQDQVEYLTDKLKEQEAVEPYVTGRGETFETAETWWYACGNCHEALDVNDKYCRHCGRSVKWE